MSDLTIRGLKDSELEQHAELVYRSYSYERDLAPGSMLTHPDWWLRAIARTPDYEPEQTRVLETDGRLVSSVTCYARPSYAAGRVVSACCLGSVCTHPDYRRRGLLRHVLDEAVRWMTGRGILWSFLYGLEDVYGGSGWRNLTTWTLSVDLREPPVLPSGVRVRPVDPQADVGAVAAVYAAFSAGLTGPTVRSGEYWRRRVLGPPSAWARPRPWFAVEAEEGLIGYFAGDDGSVSELGWISRPLDVLAAVLRQWPGQPVSMPLATPEVVGHIRALCGTPSQKECLRRQSRVTLVEAASGLWRYLDDPSGLFPELGDTTGLIRFLRERGYVMWPADRT